MIHQYYTKQHFKIGITGHEVGIENNGEDSLKNYQGELQKLLLILIPQNIFNHMIQ